jgi:hypothetical protein
VSGFDHLALLRRVDELYESVVMYPDRWTEDGFTDWASEAATGAVPSKPVAREIRRCLRTAIKLRDFWMRDEVRPDDHGDWRTRVDLALGPRAWRPALDIALAGLGEAPSEALFTEVQNRFRVVYSDRWMEDLSFSEWLTEHTDEGRSPNEPEQ